ncbi:MAG: transposase zinc-binding domain-containing protein [Planctomycetota bacterium]|nr:transposase zinc-binding domain-containing protein [Planctomycetota bacterium]
MREAARVYRPRRPERSVLYQLFERHGEAYKRAAKERFGRLRPVVVRTIEAFLECGRPQNGFARIRCPNCRAEHLLAFSCRVRNLCPRCQMKRALLLAFRLVDDLLLPDAWQRRVQNGMTRDLSWERQIQKYVALYESL